jgi:hypothetical protein
MPRVAPALLARCAAPYRLKPAMEVVRILPRI